MLKRKLYSRILDWKRNHSHSCLMIKGARQVGKTFIVREFGVNEYRSFIEINFIKQKELKDIFSGPLDAATIYKRMTAQMSDENVTEFLRWKPHRSIRRNKGYYAQMDSSV